VVTVIFERISGGIAHELVKVLIEQVQGDALRSILNRDVGGGANIACPFDTRDNRMVRETETRQIDRVV